MEKTENLNTVTTKSASMTKTVRMKSKLHARIWVLTWDQVVTEIIPLSREYSRMTGEKRRMLSVVGVFPFSHTNYISELLKRSNPSFLWAISWWQSMIGLFWKSRLPM